MYCIISLSTDYGALSTFLIFDSCETQQCTDIIISNDTVNDTRLGNSNSFFVNLQKTPDLDPRIKLDPLVAKIEITNDNGLWIRLQAILYNRVGRLNVYVTRTSCNSIRFVLCIHHNVGTRFVRHICSLWITLKLHFDELSCILSEKQIVSMKLANP